MWVHGWDVLVTTNGLPGSKFNDAIFRINNLKVSIVPGPYGFLGLVATFRLSRQLRLTLKRSASP